MRATFTKDKETRGTFRYAEEGESPVIGYLYVKKEAARALGDRITVHITPADDGITFPLAFDQDAEA